MTAPATTRPAHRRVDLAVAVGTWVVVGGVLLALPLLVAADGPSSVSVAALGSLGWWLCLATVTGQAVGLLWVGSAPSASLLTVAAVSLPLAVAGTADTFSLTGAAITLAVFVVVVRRPLRTLWPSLAAAVVAVIVGELVNGLVDGRLDAGAALGTALLQAVGVIGAPLLVGWAIAGRLEARDARRGEKRAVAGEQQALVRAAVADERTAMARELHDIAAHHLSGIAVMAAAVDRQIDTDPETAKDSVRQIRAQSTTVLADLRRLVGLLRSENDDPRAVESLAGVGELVEQRRAGGATVELQTWPASDRELGTGLGPLTQLAVYRIVQESLTNAATHAPEAVVRVEVDDRGELLTVVVVNAAPERPVTAARRGFGLVGMTERAELLGATLQYGATADGGWAVRLEVPRDGVT